MILFSKYIEFIFKSFTSPFPYKVFSKFRNHLTVISFSFKLGKYFSHKSRFTNASTTKQINH